MLSIVIVSYNVKKLLEQCLRSIELAARALTVEVIVVDNHSPDDSVGYLEPLFPSYRFISNQSNLGFAKACNQGLAITTGRYVLFLNPDTVLPEDCLEQCIGFMDEQRSAGALGVRMINGRGEYLKESKRGFPGPLVSLWKMAGLAAAFPRSRLFARYYLGHLDDNEVSEIDVISGAFFFCRRSVLEITGGFDERFFMYAEDIDLSHRIKQAGFKNFYFPVVTVLHYKGESTVKNAAYVKQFYKAMQQFSSKYMHASLARWIVQMGIKAKTGLALNAIQPAAEKNYVDLLVDGQHTVKDLLGHIEKNPGRNYRVMFR